MLLGIDNYYGFVAAVLVFQLIPGAGTVTILSATARSGQGAGMRAVVGTLAGDFVYMSAAVLGLAAVMNANPLAFRALQWLGVAYLCWTGARLLFARAHGAESRVAPVSDWHHLRRGFAVSIANPKVVLFFVSFFPQFLRSDSSPVTLLVLMAHVTAISLAYQSALVLIGDSASRRLRAVPAVGVLAKRLAGVALIAFGVKLAVNNS